MSINPRLTASYTLDDSLVVYGDNTYAYNDDGYLTEKTTPVGTTTYTYGTRGELKQVATPTQTITYKHNALNQRVAKLINGEVVEKYLWADLTTLLAVYDANDNLIQRFEYADGRMPVAMTQGSTKYYLHYDQVGSLRAISRVLSPDNTTKLVKEITYDTYGNILSDTNPSLKVPFGFAGGLYDSDTKLTRFGYRDYDAYTGKWTAKDPIGFDGGDSNFYGYVWADPINFIDENGLYGRSRVRVRPGGVGSIGGRSGSYPPFFPSSSSSSLGDSISNAIDNLFNCDSNTDDGCQAKYSKINWWVNHLQRRFRQFKENAGGLSDIDRVGYRTKINESQIHLRKLLYEASASGCLNYRNDAWYWATKPLY